MTLVLKCVRFVCLIALLSIGLFAITRASIWITTSDDTRGLSTAPEVFDWTADLPGFNGYSSVIMAPDGTSLVAASDRGHFITGTVARDASGQIVEVKALTQIPLRLHGGPPPIDRFLKDLEGMAPLPDGTIALAFESYTRLQIMDPLSGPPMQRPRSTHPWDRFQAHFHNYAFEAITALPQKDDQSPRILAIMEGSGSHPSTDAYTYDGTQWTGPIAFAKSPGFAITGADLGPDRCLYILERHFGAFTGFQFQLSRRAADDWTSPAVPLYRSGKMRLGNGEGVSVWQRDGELVATIITDNGPPSFEATRLIELPLAPARDCADQ